MNLIIHITDFTELVSDDVCLNRAWQMTDAVNMVDDVLGVASCGTDSVKLNSIIQAKMNTKNLEMGQNKCFKLHVGNKSKTFCPKLSVDDEEMKTSNSVL